VISIFKSIGLGLVIIKLVSLAKRTSLELILITVGKSLLQKRKSNGSGCMEFNVILQVQHIDSNKYNNSFKSRLQTFTPDENYSIEYCSVVLRRYFRTGLYHVDLRRIGVVSPFSFPSIPTCLLLVT